MRNIPCTDLDVQHNNTKESVLLLNKESTRSLLNLFEMRNISCTDLEVEHNNMKESVLY